jgi:hypothetical protein
MSEMLKVCCLSVFTFSVKAHGFFALATETSLFGLRFGLIG